MKMLRIYLDSSVFGGCCDPEFARESNQLLQEVRAGRFVVVASDALVTELLGAPDAVRELLAVLPSAQVESVRLTAEAEQLRDAYIAAGVVGPASREMPNTSPSRRWQVLTWS